MPIIAYQQEALIHKKKDNTIITNIVKTLHHLLGLLLLLQILMLLAKKNYCCCFSISSFGGFVWKSTNKKQQQQVRRSLISSSSYSSSLLFITKVRTTILSHQERQLYLVTVQNNSTPQPTQQQQQQRQQQKRISDTRKAFYNTIRTKKTTTTGFSKLQMTAAASSTTNSFAMNSSSSSSSSSAMVGNHLSFIRTPNTMDENMINSSNSNETSSNRILMEESSSSDDRKIEAVPSLSLSQVTSKAIITDNIQECANRLKEGKLVAFPTETVYGLGGYALNISAVQTIFRVKERPFTDPLIVHVLQPEDAFQLWDATIMKEDETATATTTTRESKDTSITEGMILLTLCKEFWPGPLTLVAKARGDVVPSIVMAGTGYCAVRAPSHPTARQLISLCGLPIAAPSANKFGHVSPTSPFHVYDDLYNEDVWILQTPTATTTTTTKMMMDSKSSSSTNSLDCEVGVESTVAKVETTEYGKFIITVLRHGAVSANDITRCLCKAGLLMQQNDDRDDDGPVITVVESNGKQKKQQKQFETSEKDDNNNDSDKVDGDGEHDNVATVAPGQTIKHYSPSIPSFIVSTMCIEELNAEISKNNNNDVHKILKNIVVIDYGQRLVQWKNHVLEYRDISPNQNSKEAAQSIFATLRWAEQITNAQIILFPEVLIMEPSSSLQVDTTDNNSCADNTDDALALAIQDKLMRAASGVIIHTSEDLKKRFCTNNNMA